MSYGLWKEMVSPELQQKLLQIFTPQLSSNSKLYKGKKHILQAK